jgi:hypothetical protein
MKTATPSLRMPLVRVESTDSPPELVQIGIPS